MFITFEGIDGLFGGAVPCQIGKVLVGDGAERILGGGCGSSG